MSAEQNTAAATAEVLEQEQSVGVYASLLKKINLAPVDQLSDISAWRDEADMAEAGASQRVTAAWASFWSSCASPVRKKLISWIKPCWIR